MRGSAFVPHDLGAPIKGAAAGPLAGTTAAIKDMYDIAGERTGGGNPEWLASRRPAAVNSGSVQRLLDAGATITGKTVCDEFFFSLSGANAHYGTPVNPRAPGRLPGGSSSGSASAVSAGDCDVALGSDTGGSCRVPAAFCGVYGIRPTHGRTDLNGAMLMAPTFDVAGWFASDPKIFAKAGATLLIGEARRDLPTRVLIAADAFEQAQPKIAQMCRAFLSAVSADMPDPEEIRIARSDFDSWRQCFRIIQGREIWSIYGAWIEAHKPNLGPGIKERMAYAATVSPEEAVAARQSMAIIRAHVRETIKPGTVLALPTAPCIAPKLDEPPEGLEQFRSSAMALTSIAGLSGLPQVSLPIGTLDGCPVGLSFIGWPGADETLLDLAVPLAAYCGSVN
jgi:amidase